MNINNRIKKVRDEFCGGSNVEFARKLGKKTNTTSNWVRNGYSVGRGVVSEIAAVFCINSNWLLTGEGEMLTDSAKKIGDAVKASADEFVLIDYIPVRASASFIESLCDEKAYDFEKIPVIPRNGEVLKPEEYKIFEVSGDSMSPTINDGAQILVKEIPEGKWAYAEGVAVVVFQDMVVIKRITRNDILNGNCLFLSSDNPKYGQMQVALSDIRAIYKAKRKISENIF